MFRSTLLMLALVALLAACAPAGTGDGADQGNGDGASTEAPDGGDGDGPAGGGQCRFVTAAEVEAAFGVAVEPVETDVTCTFNDGDGNMVLIYTYVPQGGRSAFESQREEFEGAVEIDGIGDGALFFPGGGMYVLKGDGVLNVTAGSGVPQAGDDAALQAALEEVGRAAAGRMP